MVINLAVGLPTEKYQLKEKNTELYDKNAVGNVASFAGENSTGESLRPIMQGLTAVGGAIEAETRARDKTDFLRHKNELLEAQAKWIVDTSQLKGLNALDDPTTGQQGLAARTKEFFDKQAEIANNIKFRWGDTKEGYLNFFEETKNQGMQSAALQEKLQETEYKKSVMAGEFEQLLKMAGSGAMSVSEIEVNALDYAQMEANLTGVSVDSIRFQRTNDLIREKLMGQYNSLDIDGGIQALGEARHLLDENTYKQMENLFEVKQQELNKAYAVSADKLKSGEYLENVGHIVSKAGKVPQQIKDSWQEAFAKGAFTQEEYDNVVEYGEIQELQFVYLNNPKYKNFTTLKNQINEDFKDGGTYNTIGENGAKFDRYKTALLENIAKEEALFQENPDKYLQQEAVEFTDMAIEKGLSTEAERQKYIINIRHAFARERGLIDLSKQRVLLEDEAKAYKESYDKSTPEVKVQMLAGMKESLGKKDYYNAVDEIGLNIADLTAGEWAKSNPKLAMSLQNVSGRDVQDLEAILKVEQKENTNNILQEINANLDSLENGDNMLNAMREAWHLNPKEENEQDYFAFRDTLKKLFIYEATLHGNTKDIFKAVKKELTNKEHGQVVSGKNFSLIIAGDRNGKAIKNGLDVVMEKYQRIAEEHVLIMIDDDHIAFYNPDSGTAKIAVDKDGKQENRVLILSLKDMEALGNKAGVQLQGYSFLATPLPVVGIRQQKNTKDLPKDEVALDQEKRELVKAFEAGMPEEDFLLKFNRERDLLPDEKIAQEIQQNNEAKWAQAEKEANDALKQYNERYGSLNVQTKGGSNISGKTRVQGLNATDMAKVEKYINYFSNASEKYGVDMDLALRIAKIESNFNANAKSPAGAMGIMQVMPATANDLGLTNPYDAKSSIDAGVKYIRQIQNYLVKKFKLSGAELTEATLISYNWGMGNYGKWRKRGKNYASLPKETRNYIDKIMV